MLQVLVALPRSGPYSITPFFSLKTTPIPVCLVIEAIWSVSIDATLNAWRVRTNPSCNSIWSNKNRKFNHNMQRKKNAKRQLTNIESRNSYAKQENNPQTHVKPIQNARYLCAGLNLFPFRAIFISCRTNPYPRWIADNVSMGVLSAIGLSWDNTINPRWMVVGPPSRRGRYRLGREWHVCCLQTLR